jgi:hypothetical protein
MRLKLALLLLPNRLLVARVQYVVFQLFYLRILRTNVTDVHARLLVISTSLLQRFR